MRVLVALAILIISLSLLTTCRPQESVDSASETPTPSTVVAVSPTDGIGLIFVVEQQASGMESQTEGRLVKRGHCLVVLSSPKAEPAVPIWPPGFAYDRRHGSIVVLDGDEVVAGLGDHVVLGGGIAGDLPHAIDEQLAQCDGYRWMVSKVSTS